MKFELQDLAETLKSARATKRLSQRALSQKISVPQSHISKIESGHVDIKASSLVQIARALGLEMMLVPQSLVPAVEALTRSALGKSGIQEAGQDDAAAPLQAARHALKKAEKDAKRALRHLGTIPEISRLVETARELDSVRLTTDDAEQIRDALKNYRLPTDALKEAMRAGSNINIARTLRETNQATNALRTIRNAIAHGATAPAARALPVYRLSDGDDDA